MYAAESASCATAGSRNSGSEPRIFSSPVAVPVSPDDPDEADGCGLLPATGLPDELALLFELLSLPPPLATTTMRTTASAMMPAAATPAAPRMSLLLMPLPQLPPPQTPPHPLECTDHSKGWIGDHE